MSASSQCPHSDLHFHLHAEHMGDANVHLLNITASCKICGAKMEWLGPPMGNSFARPTVSIDRLELRVPFVGEGEKPSTQIDMTIKQIG